MGETNFGVTPESVARHEYGHHIAAPPPECSLGRSRLGNEEVGDLRRGLLPGGHRHGISRRRGGELSAQPRRGIRGVIPGVARDEGSATGFSWPIVDASFRPNAQALAALREDVLHPWETTATRIIRGAFTGRSRMWTGNVATPLDGELRIQVNVPGGGVTT